jgi:hypothetical protein
MNGFHGGVQEERRLFIGRRPASRTIRALPVQIELWIDDDDRFGAPAPGTSDGVFIKELDDCWMSSHTEVVGCQGQTL